MTTASKVNVDKIVTTISGLKCKRHECRFIKGDYYKKNVECFKFEGRWYRINSGFIAENFETGKWELKEGLIQGLVLKDSKVAIGYFSEDPSKNVSISLSSIPYNLKNSLKLPKSDTVQYAYAIDEKVPLALELEEEISTGVFREKSVRNKKIAINNSYDFRVDYSFENTAPHIVKTFYENLEKFKMPYKMRYANCIPHSFGYEFETTDGYIHPRKLIQGGLIPLRDGSIAGYEYVTVPLEGEKGLFTIKKSADIMSKYTTKNKMCSLHLHLGKLPVSEKYLEVAYKVCSLLQNEIYSMFPPALANTSTYKSRDYCNKLNAKISTSKGIINWFAGHSEYYDHHFEGLGKKHHPADSSNSHKWNIQQRYLWVNFIPYIFSKRHTIEFRIHTPTTNKYKLINWLFICSAILQYAELHLEDDTINPKLTLDEVLKDVYPPEVFAYLSNYIKARVKMMEAAVKLGDIVGEIEINNDLDYENRFSAMRETLID
jgi:hypothetical protein